MGPLIASSFLTASSLILSWLFGVNVMNCRGDDVLDIASFKEREEKAKIFIFFFVFQNFSETETAEMI